MAVRSVREKSKMQEKYQVILSQMLREDDNRYCVDCDAKSPRWTSWNIGVFICIRCAGFHRNLGVHISKVKSINLDSWTIEQIASMQAMGNSRARAVYEANLPDGFRRPQADPALESFIRAKYEQRKWIAKEWIPPEITLIESETNQPEVETTLNTEPVEKTVSKLKPFAVPISTNNPVRQTTQSKSSPPTTPNIENNTQNLLNLDEPSSTSSTNTSSLTSVPPSNTLDPLHELFTTASQNKTEANIEVQSIDKDLESAFSSSNDTSANHNGIMSNEKIMALFNIPQISAGAPSGMNIRPTSIPPPNIPSPGFVYPPAQHSHSLSHQKSLSFGNNLYQQATNFGSQTQHGYPYPSHSGINHHNLNGMSVPTLQSPASTFTQEELNTQFSQFMPFANTKRVVYNLQCMIYNPGTEIDSTKCEIKKFTTITIVMSNLEDLELFCLNNNQTVMEFLTLFNQVSWFHTTFTIKLGNLSSSDRVELAINNQWITKFFGHHKHFYSNLHLNMEADDWSKINLTIHVDINTNMEIKYIKLNFKQTDASISCSMDIAPSLFYKISYMNRLCPDFITFIDSNGSAVHWSTTLLTSPSTTEEIIWFEEVSTTNFKPIRPRTFEIPTISKETSSSGLQKNILWSILIIIISLTVIICCLMKRNRNKTVPQTYSQSVITNPVYTSNAPMYYNPSYNQK